jgi:hypothetical protein
MKKSILPSLKILIFIVLASCTPSPYETTWELKILHNKLNKNKHSISNQILNRFKFLSYGSSDENVIRIGGDYDDAVLGIWIYDDKVIVFERCGETDGPDPEFQDLIKKLRLLLEKNGIKVDVRSYREWGIFIG